MTTPTPAAHTPTPVLTDAAGDRWELAFGDAELADIRRAVPADAGGPIDLAELADDPAALWRLLSDRQALLALVLFGLRRPARARGLGPDAVSARMADLIDTAAGRAAATAAVLIGVALAFPASLLAALALAADSPPRRWRPLHPGAVRPFLAF